MATFFEAKIDGRECFINADDIRFIAPMPPQNTQINWRNTEQKTVIETPFEAVETDP